MAIPGLVNTHHHLYQTLTRNLPAVQDRKLFDWLIYLYEVWRHVTPEGVDISAQVGLGELLLTGCTTSSDHFYIFPGGKSADLFVAHILKFLDSPTGIGKLGTEGRGIITH